MAELHAAALNYIDVPFLHMGRTRRGVDCVGLLVLAARDCGYANVGDTPPYGREPRNGLLAAQLRQHLGAPVDRPPQINDVLLMRLSAAAAPSHVAIVTDHPHGLGIVHAYGQIGRVVHQRLDDSHRRRIAEVYAWPEKY